MTVAAELRFSVAEDLEGTPVSFELLRPAASTWVSSVFNLSYQDIDLLLSEDEARDRVLFDAVFGASLGSLRSDDAEGD